MEPRLIELKYSVDDRGAFSFIDEMDFSEIKRFYFLSNHEANFVRAWHYHEREEKYVVAVAGTAVVGAVRVEDPLEPSKESEKFRYVLSSNKPSMLYIPAGFANGAMTLTPDTKLLYFSTASLQESVGDDVRYPHDFWNLWEVNRR